jgi:predicted acyl esterase
LTKKNFSRIHPSGLEPQSFLSKGYAALLPDSRGEGESGGRFLTYGVKEGDDVRRWFGWLAAQKHPRCIFGMGESMGAAILLQSVREETRFCAVIAESSFASFRQIAYVRVNICCACVIATLPPRMNVWRDA